MLYLSPLLKAKARIDRLTALSRQITRTAQQHPWLSPVLLPPHLLLRWLSQREFERLNAIGYPLTRAANRSVRSRR